MKYSLLLLTLIFVACDTTKNIKRNRRHAVNLVKNGTFINDINYWMPWQNAKNHTNLIKVATYKGKYGKYKALRIENGYKKLIGLNQAVKVEKNKVYKLSASARSVLTNSSAIIFGARVGIRLPKQKERCLIWVTEFNNWWKKSLVFTNNHSGTAVVFVDMGYGNIISTGEFSDIKFVEVSE